jgi:predicted nucleic acid-binding protein
MTVFLDSSALISLHIESASRAVVQDALNSDTTWAACAITLAESVAAISRLTDEPVLQRYLEDKIRHTWDYLHVVPMDQVLLDEAAALCTRQPVGLSTSLHLCAAARLPSSVQFVTFDAAQIPVALSMGFTVVSG